MRLQRNVVIVSGAARGIGAAEVRALVEEGACVVIGDLLDDLGRTLASELNAGRLSACAEYLHLDATRMEDWEHAVRLAEASFGRLTTLVNNAGVHGRLGLEETSEDEWQRVLDADLKSAWLGMKACTHRGLRPKLTGE